MEKSEKYITKYEIEGLEHNRTLISERLEKLNKKYERSTSHKERNRIESELSEYQGEFNKIDSEIIKKVFDLNNIKESDLIAPLSKDMISLYSELKYKGLYLKNHNTKKGIESAMVSKTSYEEQGVLEFGVQEKINKLRKYFSEHMIHLLNAEYEEIKKETHRVGELEIFCQLCDAFIKRGLLKNPSDREIKYYILMKFEKDYQDCFDYRHVISYGSPSKSMQDILGVARLSRTEVKELQDDLTIVIKANETLEDKLKKADHI